jgi:hypothetical protein
VAGYCNAVRQGLTALHRPEIVEMITALANGSDMGPGEGWFHGGQTRYGWQWLAARYDTNHNGKITRAEFHGPKELFDRLDRDHNGILNADDFDWSDNSRYAHQGRMASYWFRSLDTNSNGRVSEAEWLALFRKAAKGKSYLTPDDLREAFPTTPPQPPPGPPPKNDEPSPFVMVLGLLSGELGSFFEGPAVGQKAPDFLLRTEDGKAFYTLSQYRGQKPVVLNFGSFT